MDVIEIDVTSLKIEMKAKERRSQIHILVIPFFNGKRITEYLGNVADQFNIFHYIMGLYKDGNYFLFSCDCGDPGCGGWFVPIEVYRDNHKVIWLIDNYKAIKGIYHLNFDLKLIEEQKQLINNKLSEFEKLYQNNEVYFQHEHGYSLNVITNEINKIQPSLN